MSEREEQHFIKGFLTWIKTRVDQEVLTVFNFSYERPLPFPSIALTPGSTLRLNLQTSAIQAQSRRSVAVIGEKYVGQFEEIMKVHEETQTLPFAVFLQSENKINLNNMSSHYMRETPSLVGIS